MTINLNNNNCQELNDDVFAKLDAIIETVELTEENTQELNDDVFARLDAIIESNEEEAAEESTGIDEMLIDETVFIQTTECTIKARTKKAVLLEWAGRKLWVPKSALLPTGADVFGSIECMFKTWFLIACENKNLSTPYSSIELHTDPEHLIVNTAILNAKHFINNPKGWSAEAVQQFKRIVNFYA